MPATDAHLGPRLGTHVGDDAGVDLGRGDQVVDTPAHTSSGAPVTLHPAGDGFAAPPRAMVGEAMRARCRTVATLLLLTACAAPLGWRHAGLPEDRWRPDEAACNRQAAQKVDEEAARRGTVPGDSALGRGAAYESAMARLEAARRVRTLVADCMAARGYEKATRD